MGIPANYQVTRYYQAFFRQDDMLNPHAAHFEVLDFMFEGIFPHPFRNSRRLDVLVRGKVVGDNDNFLGVKDALSPFDLLKFFNGYNSGKLIGQNQVNLGIDDLPGPDRIFTGMGSQDFFRNGHSHI